MTEIEVIEGDALEVLAEMGPGQFDLVLADPPFNVGKDYGEDHDDRLPWSDYLKWVGHLYGQCFRVSAENATAYAFCIGQHILAEPPVQQTIRAAGWRPMQLLTWYRPNGPGPHRRPSGQVWALMSEEIIECRKGCGLRPLPNDEKAPWYHNVLRVNTPQSNHPAGRWHPCEKPVRLYSLLIQAHVRPARVLDPTCGSGSALIACAELGIPAVGIELNPDYCRVARDRVAAALDGQKYREARKGTVPLFKQDMSEAPTRDRRGPS
jgi:site-specific DNA-methyltransferase (adenine-specific)